MTAPFDADGSNTPSPAAPTRTGPAAADTRPAGPPGDSTRPTPSSLRELAGPPPAVPGYEILGELGRGAMGVVYHARQVKLNRAVALKMLLGADRADPKALIRFLAEAEAVAAVRHPNVVGVYE